MRNAKSTKIYNCLHPKTIKQHTQLILCMLANLFVQEHAINHLKLIE